MLIGTASALIFSKVFPSYEEESKMITNYIHLAGTLVRRAALLARNTATKQRRNRASSDGNDLNGLPKKYPHISHGCFAWIFALVILAAVPAQAQFVVNSTGDEPDTSSVDGVCLTGSGTCTLRAAIQQANASAGANTISFSIPGAGPHTITPATALPIITGPITIDGYTQPGATPNTNPTDPAVGPRLGSNAVLMIVLNGAGLNANGLDIQAGSSTIRGLVINGFDFDKIFVNGAQSGGSANVIEGNFIGTDVTGMIDASPAGFGIRIVQSPNNVIGGVLPAQRNVIAGNNLTNILVNLAGLTGVSGNVKIQGNLIGTNAAGTAVLGAGTGIRLSGGSNNSIRPADNHIIGGTDGDDGVIDGLVQARNIISGHATGIHNNESKGSRISGNFIGTDVTGTVALENTAYGIEISGVSSDTLVGGWSGSTPPGAPNIISGNQAGILITGNAATPTATAGIMVQSNRIGMSADGLAMGNTIGGIFVDGVSGFTIGGGPSPLIDANATNVIAYNGTSASQPAIRVAHSTSSLISGNIIAANRARGVHIFDANSNGIQISQNQMYSNGLLGIDLQSLGQLASGVTPNDVGDGDTGANLLQNFPDLTSATGTVAGTSVNGSLKTTICSAPPCPTFLIEFFVSLDVNADPSGFGEGEFYLGATSIQANAVGVSPISVPSLPSVTPFITTSGRPVVITATATDSLGNTSEFSNWVPVTLLNSPPVANAGADFSVDESVLVTLNGTASIDPDGNSLTYTWTQIPLPTVMLNNDTTATPSFTAPVLLSSGSTTLTFQLVVNDGLVNSAPDFVNVTVVNVNQAPIAMVGPAQTVNEGSLVTLDGSASFDPDNDPKTFSWNQVTGPIVLPPNTPGEQPTFTAPLITTSSVLLEFELVVNDGFTDSAPARAQVTVVNVNQAPIANAGPDQTRDEGSLVTLNGTLSGDPDFDPLTTFEWTQVPTGTMVTLSNGATATPSFIAPLLPTGTQEQLRFRLRVSDGLAFSAQDEVVITVQDVNAPPACNLAQAMPSSLWPANHSLKQVNIVGVTDPDNNPINITILSVTQDEPVSGLDRHDVSPDAVIQPGNVLLRGERDRNGNGRVYHIDFSATDSNGASCTGLVKVNVPLTRSGTSIDGGRLYNSLVP